MRRTAKRLPERMHVIALRAALLMIGILVLLAAGGLAARAQPGVSSSEDAGYTARLDAFVELVGKRMQEDHTTGLVIGFATGDFHWVRAFGYADVENRTPMHERSAFRLASVTKPMTATGVLQLVEQGKMNLDAEIQEYVPYYPRKPWPVTVRQLLGHVGGITHYKNLDLELHIKEHKDPRQAIAIFADYDLVAEPGTKYSYSTYGYNLLGAALEAASGQAYGDYMRDHIWGPARMADTRMDDPREIIPNRVRGYERSGGALRNSEFVDVSSRFAGGGTRSTVPDMLRFGHALMDGALVSAATLDSMTTPMRLRDGQVTYYGMGGDLLPVDGHFMFSHSGGQNETRTLLFVLPARNLAIAAATNFESGDLFWYVQALVQQVLEERWNRSGGTSIYARGKVAGAQIDCLRLAFNHGLSLFEKRGTALTEDPERLRSAFAWLNRHAGSAALKGGRTTAAKELEEGRQPLHGQPLLVVGSYVAKRLAEHQGSGRQRSERQGSEGQGFTREGAEGLEAYHRSGALTFFADYVAMCRKTPSIPTELRLSRSLEKQVESWARTWARTCNEEVRTQVIASCAPFDGEKLRRSFAGASVYPDLAWELAGVVRGHYERREREPALRAAQLAQDLYPQSGVPHVYLAAAQLCFGERRQAKSLISKAAKLGDGSFASAGFLNNMGYSLAEGCGVEAGIDMLRIATELHPKAANLFDSLGELQLRQGEREAAIASYKKALAIDPKLESATRALAEIEEQAKVSKREPAPKGPESQVATGPQSQAATAPEGGGLAAKLQAAGVDFYGRGNEPSWALDLDFEKGMRFSTLDGLVLHTPPVEGTKAQDADVTRFAATTEAGSLIVTVRGGECIDNMSGYRFTHEVRVQVRKSGEMETRSFIGCGQYIPDVRLDGNWILVSLDGETVRGNAESKGRPTLALELGELRVSGHGGCNRLTGTFSTEARTIRFGTLASTRMACADMRAETAFLEALSGGRFSYSLDDGQLHLTGHDGTKLVFESTNPGSADRLNRR